MATVKHTEGPWVVEGFVDRSRPSELRLSVVEPTTRTIVALLSCAADDAESVEATKADAKLCAAAPELADVLEVYLDGLGGGFLLDADKARLLKRIEGLHQNARVILRKAGRFE